jgi:hypothetical protein
MNPIIEYSTKQVNKWNNNYISPGIVGPIGDVNQNVRLKQSTSELPMRWLFTDPQLIKRAGQNVQDGTVSSNGGLGAETVIEDVYSDMFETRQVGTVYQDLRKNDLTVDSRIMARPQDSWKSQASQVLNARVTGQAFLPSPGGFVGGGVPRGTGLTHQSIMGQDVKIFNNTLDSVVEQKPGNVINEDYKSCPIKMQTLQQYDQGYMSSKK